MWQRKGFRNIAAMSVVGAGVVVGTQFNSGDEGVSTPMIQQSLAYSNDHQKSQAVKLPHWKSAEPMPTRDLVWKQLQARSKSREEYDVLVIGGGATGTGCALDAQTRFVTGEMHAADALFSRVSVVVQGFGDTFSGKRGLCCWNLVKVYKVGAWWGKVLGKGV